MRRMLRCAVVLFAVWVAALQAQAPITGNWQGTLNAGQQLRMVVVIANGDGGGLRATFYSIDQTSQGLPGGGVTLQGNTFRASLPGLNATFEGTLNADRSSMAGTLTMGGNALPLTLSRATPETAWAIPEAPKPMTDAGAVFDVATIKPSIPDRPGKLFTVKGRQVLTINTSVNDLMTMAYEVHTRQITGGPSWLESDKYDITGQPVGQGLPSLPQMRAMIRQLMTDRFKLTFHREKRELSAYAITVAPGGPKMTKNDGNPNGLPNLLFRGLGNLPGSNATIADLASVMQTAVLDRPVVDRTGLPGRYDFTLLWTPDETQFNQMGVRVPPPSPDATAPVLFTAFQEQLGLKLESTKAPVDVIVIDRIERPSEN
jgi:uncharacterized protein (TIGR03435 family)